MGRGFSGETGDDYAAKCCGDVAVDGFGRHAGSAELPTNLAFSGANLHPIAEAVTPFTHNKQRGF
jgi:hypothetical protein